MNVTRSGFARLFAAGAALVGAPVSVQAADAKSHRLAIHVDQNDPAIMNQALNNVTNVIQHYTESGAPIQIEVVAYGPGLNMLRDDTSPVKARLASMKASMPQLIFSACNVTKTAMEKAEGHPITIVPQARIVPSGVVRLTELQESGYAYVKP